MNIMAVKSGMDINISPRATDLIKQEDILVVIGSIDDLSHIEGLVSND
ncbi:hypothetical protein [Proteiniclasticum sp.]|nr:hypothetical protein [Proteiniclasticum sp.]